MAHRRQNHLRLVLPTPTPDEIEAALIAIRDGTSAYGRWVRLDQTMDKYQKVVAEADNLWWVEIVDPDGVQQDCCGGGTTLAEAAAVAWINACTIAWWAHGPGISDEDYAIVRRHVPDGYRFELYERPVSCA